MRIILWLPILALVAVVGYVFIYSFSIGPGEDKGSVCRGNLQNISNAKEEAIRQRGLTNGATVPLIFVTRRCKGYVLPECPAGGLYVIGVVGQKPSCTVHGNRPLP
jgi:hypothetical protein